MFSYRYKDGYITYDRDENRVFFTKESLDGIRQDGMVEYSKGITSDRKTNYGDDVVKEVQITYISTPSCNLNCKYCYEHNSSANIRNITMSEEQHFEIFKAIQDYYISSKVKICFFGGEPFLAKDSIFNFIERLSSYCKDNNKEFPYISAITNGTLLDNDTVKLIHKHFDGITFSLDGTKILHDTNRVYRSGIGTFDDVVLGIKRLNEINIDKKVTMACEVTITDAYFENYSKSLVREIWKLFKTLKFDIVEFIIVIDDNAILVKKENNLDMLAKELVDLWYEDLLIGQSMIKIPSLFSYLALLVGRKTNENMRCGAGINYFAADSNYNIYPCQVSVYKDSNVIGEAKDYTLRFKEDKDTIYIDKNEHELCKQCECLRGCTSFCKIIMNDISNEEPCSCLFNKKVFKYSLLKITELLDSNQKDVFIQGVKKMISKEIDNEK